MSTIKIDQLYPTGSELFSDSESYMSEFNDRELDVVSGASTPFIALTYGVRSSPGCLESAIKISGAAAGSVKATIKISNPFNSF